jgi:hypothetical protein
MHPEVIALWHSAVEHDGRLSILSPLDTITVPDLPYPFPPFALACSLRFEDTAPGEHELKVTVAERDGRILAQMGVLFRLPEEPSRTPTTLCIVFPISGMELRCVGEHVIDLMLDGQAPVRNPFQVKKV